MLRVDEEALICDLAEIYHIYDYQAWPLYQVAIYANGLRPESRIMLKLADQSLPYELTIQSAIFDRLNLLLWSKTIDGQKNINRPKSILESFTSTTSSGAYQLYINGQDFDTAWAKLTEGGGQDGN